MKNSRMWRWCWPERTRWPGRGKVLRGGDRLHTPAGRLWESSSSASDSPARRWPRPERLWRRWWPRRSDCWRRSSQGGGGIRFSPAGRTRRCSAAAEDTMLPVWSGAVSLHTRLSLPGEDGGSEEESWSPKSQRAGDKRHRGEAEGGQHEAVAAEEDKQGRSSDTDGNHQANTVTRVSLLHFLFIWCTKNLPKKTSWWSRADCVLSQSYKSFSVSADSEPLWAPPAVVKISCICSERDWQQTQRI